MDWRFCGDVQVLPLCTELRRLALDDNDKLTVKSARLIAKALEAGAAPHLTMDVNAAVENLPVKRGAGFWRFTP